MSAVDDLRAWLAGRDPDAPPEYPPLVWVAAPDVVAGARLSADATTLEHAGGTLRASLDAEDRAQSLVFRRVVGRVLPPPDASRCAAGSTDGAFVIRTLWPEDFRLDRAPPPYSRSPRTCRRPLALRALMRSEPAGGAKSAFAASTLWQRDPARDPVPPGRAVLGIMVNGAQGRRRRGARGPLRARHRPHARGRRDRRLAGQQFLHAGQRKRERHPRGAGSARQLSRRPQQRPGLVPALAHAGRRARRRARERARAGGAEPRLQPVLAPPARLPARHDELHRHQRGRPAHAGLGGSGARPREPHRRGPGLPVLCGQGALDREGVRRLRLPDRGPDAPHAGRRLRGSRREPAVARRRRSRRRRPTAGALARMLAADRRRRRLRPVSAVSVQPGLRRRARGHACGNSTRACPPSRG